MDTGKFRTLKLLETIEQDDCASQRAIASRLGISVGLVNSFIKRLAQKGYFKIKTIPRNRVRYILTAKGAAEKTRLTYQFIIYSFRYYRENCQKIEQLYSRLEDEGHRSVLFYGKGELAGIALVLIGESKLEFIGYLEEGLDVVSCSDDAVERTRPIGLVKFDAIIVTKENSIAEAVNGLHKAFPQYAICTL